MASNCLREKKLLEKNKALKGENRKLIILLKESEEAMSKKLKASKCEMEKMINVINLIWPLVQTFLKSGSQN